MTKTFNPLATVFVCVTMVLAGCAQISPVLQSQPSESMEDQAAARAAQGDHAQAAQLYLEAGKNAQEPRRSALLLAGAKAAGRTDDRALSQTLLDSIDPSALDNRGQAWFELLHVQQRIANKPPSEALQLLSPPASGAPPEVAARIWALRAQLFFDSDQIFSGVHALVQRDVWLLDPAAVKANDERIWQRLNENLPPAGALAPQEDEITQGWVTLARIGEQVWPDREALERELRLWERQHPGHPAVRHILPERFDYAPTQPASGGQGEVIGVALPLTGNFASASRAIQDGFLAGFYSGQSRESTARPSLRFYDTNTLENVAALIEQTRIDGVSLLVGPLQKPLASELAQRQDLQMPVIALNYTDFASQNKSFYEFGLAPEDEARAAANRGLAMNFRSAIALVPEGGWGERVLTAFRDEFAGAGGELVDFASYDPSSQDHANPIKRVLRYGPNGPREDIDFVFLAAQPQEARQIRSQLRFYRASQLPVLATSHLYSGATNRSEDSELDGIMFADMPWIIGDDPVRLNRRAEIRQLWPRIDKRYPRLFAMGGDAWLLTQAVLGGPLEAGTRFQGDTGTLVVRPSGKVQRELEWAEFRRGKPRALPPVEQSFESTQPQPLPAENGDELEY